MNSSRGFTIIELVISIFILSVALVGIFSAFSVVIILTSDSADRLTATYLAQEGMEIVRNIRDTNWLNMDAASPANATWVDGLTNPASCTIDAPCQADYNAKSMSYYVPGNYLYLNAAGFYVYNPTDSSATKTKFEREIIITPIQDVDGSSDHIIKVKVQVSWDEKATILNPGFSANTCGAYNCITTEETLYDWYNYVHQ